MDLCDTVLTHLLSLSPAVQAGQVDLCDTVLTHLLSLSPAVQAGQVDLDGLVEQQLSPLLAAVRHWLVSLCAVLMALLCVMFLCHCGATVARYYMLVWGHLPRVAIFQISENSSLMYDGRPDPHKPMQRSASWLESCESGVYVGENDLDNTFSRDHL